MANRIWAEVFTPAGVKLGIVNLISASITHRLDAAGELSIQVATTDHNAQDWLALWREIRLYWDHPLRGKTYVGSGILQEKSAVNQRTTMWAGQNQLEELRRPNTLQGLIYDDIPVSVAVRDLLTNSSGWSAGVEDGLNDTTRRFDGQTVLQALFTIAGGVGSHMRLTGERRIEVGEFGEDAGVMLTNLNVSAREAWSNSQVAFIDPPSITYSGYDIANWVVPLWGNGDAVLTLKRSTRSSPYTVQSGTYNGKTVYYLADATSIAAYGTIQRVLTMKDAPYVGEDTLENAANTLYDWGAAKLARSKDPQTTYTISGVKLDRDILPGQKVHVRYDGAVIGRGDNLPDYWLQVDGLMWVLAISRTFNAKGQRFSLEVSNIDQQPLDAATILVNTVMDADLSGVQQRLTSTLNRTSETVTVSTVTPGSMTFEIADMAVDIGYSTLKVTREVGGPDTLDLVLDGTTIADGPYLWGTESGTTFTVLLEDVLLAQADWHGEHTLTISCQQSSGDLEVVVEVTEIGRTV
jgi:hypothetical protein